MSEQETRGEDVLLAESARRREDCGLILGQTKFVDDIRPTDERPGTLHMLVVRSPYGHARIEGIDAGAARQAAGVVAVVTGSDLRGKLKPLEGMHLPDLNVAPRLPLAVARTRYQGIDARDLVDVT